MRHATLLALSLVAATGCVSEEATDGKDDVGLSDGKADGEQLTACEKAAIVSYLNEGVSAAALVEAGVNSRAAKNLTTHRDGQDRRFGTPDDDKFDTMRGTLVAQEKRLLTVANEDERVMGNEHCGFRGHSCSNQLR